MSLTKFSFILTIAALALAMVGCYDEPRRAELTVPAEKRIYLKSAALKELSIEAVYNKGLIYDDSSWTNLSSRATFEEFKSSKVKSIDYLNLDYNSLTNVDAVAEFSSLKWLRLNDNRLNDLPKNLNILSNLKSIYLKANKFASVPEVLKDMRSLVMIDLSYNSGITEVPEWLAKMQGLEDLSFSGTSITSLPEDISAWKSLRILQLGDLKMTTVEMKRIREALPETTVVY